MTFWDNLMYLIPFYHTPRRERQERFVEIEKEIEEAIKSAEDKHTEAASQVMKTSMKAIVRAEDAKIVLDSVVDKIKRDSSELVLGSLQDALDFNRGKKR